MPYNPNLRHHRTIRLKDYDWIVPIFNLQAKNNSEQKNPKDSHVYNNTNTRQTFDPEGVVPCCVHGYSINIRPVGSGN
jgi:hypothetical protein